MHHHGGVGLIRVRCQHDAQGRECLSLHACPYEHWLAVNCTQLSYMIGVDSNSATVYREEVGVVGVRGWGMRPGQRQLSGFFVCNSSHPAWGIPGPMTQAGYRSMHKGTNRRIAKQGWGTLAQSGGASVTPEVSRTGDFNGHRSGGGSSQPGLLRREATPFSPLNLAAADQSNDGSLMTTHAAAAATAAASTTVDAPDAQQ